MTVLGVWNPESESISGNGVLIYLLQYSKSRWNTVMLIMGGDTTRHLIWSHFLWCRDGILDVRPKLKRDCRRRDLKAEE
jgi:hypothetical protein